MTVIPLYGVCPVLVMKVVKRTTSPGVMVVSVGEVSTISSPATVTVSEQRGSVLPAPQLLPTESDTRVLERIPFPVPGVFAVTE